jgi:hypothetical protein
VNYQKAEKTEDPEDRLEELIASTYADPLAYALVAFPWGEKGTVLERHPDGPDEWHRELFSAMAQTVLENIALRSKGEPLKPFRAAVASGHGVGKSACVAWIILWLMSTRVDCRGIVTANTEGQLSTRTWPELAKWHNLAINKHWFEWTATRFSYAKYPEDRKKNYCFDAVPWSEHRSEAFAGLHNETSAVCYIFDEASGVPAKISEVASGGLTDGEPFWLKFGNPTEASGDFFECFHRLRHLWLTLHVNSLDVRITNKRYLQELLEQWGPDSYEYRVRVMGQFPLESATQLIATYLVDDAEKREVVLDKEQPLILGVDVARFGDDRSVLFFRRGMDARSIAPIAFSKMDTAQTTARVVEAAHAFNPAHIVIDGVGVGGGVVDRLKLLGFRILDINGGARADSPKRYFNRRAEMWVRMRDWLQGGGCIPEDKYLRPDLIAPEYKYSSSQQIHLERKEDMKRRGLGSPDFGDALALTFASRFGVAGLATLRGAPGRAPKVAIGVDCPVF